MINFKLTRNRMFGNTIEFESNGSTQEFMYDVPDKIADIIEDLQHQSEQHDRLLKIAKKMHLYIFLHTGNEQEVYDELGLTEEENKILGYSGQFIIKDKEEK